MKVVYWLSHFGGPAWTFDERTGQYYLHQFVKQQPELNYRNPDVLAAMRAVMRFWLDRGVDGFRVDVINLLLKDSRFRDEPLNPEWDGLRPFDRLKHIYTANLPEVHDLIAALRARNAAGLTLTGVRVDLGGVARCVRAQKHTSPKIEAPNV